MKTTKEREIKNIDRNISTANFSSNQANFKYSNFFKSYKFLFIWKRVIPMPKNSIKTLEKIGFARNPVSSAYSNDYKPSIIMPNLKKINHYATMKNSFMKSLPKNINLDKVILIFAWNLRIVKKERLYEENLNLKSFINSLTRENMQMRTKLISLDVIFFFIKNSIK